MKDIWLVVIVASFVILTPLVSYFLCKRIFLVKRESTQDPHKSPSGEQYETFRDEINRMVEEACALPYEDVSIKSGDRLKLCGKLYVQHENAPLVILVHGYRGNSCRDFAGGLPYALEAGYNALLIDQRAHGNSEGKWTTLGTIERRDIVKWIYFANERFGEETPIILSGISMGAATVLMASDLNLPKNVKGIIADSPYTSPYEIIKKVLRDRRKPAALLMPLLSLGTALFCGFGLDEGDVISSVRRTLIPMLLIHGEDDRLVPCEMSRKIYQFIGTKRKKLVTVPDADHGLSFVVDPEGVKAAMDEFIEAVVNGDWK